MLRPLPEDWTIASIPQLSSHIAISQSKILGWIRSGELIATNMASTTSGCRPMYRVSRPDYERFLASRSTAPAVAQARQSRRSAVKDFV